MTTHPRAALAFEGLPNDDPVSKSSRGRATLTLPEAAQVLGISRSTAYELARTGKLPVLRLGRRLVIPTNALNSLLESVDRNAD